MTFLSLYLSRTMSMNLIASVSFVTALCSAKLLTRFAEMANYRRQQQLTTDYLDTLKCLEILCEFGWQPTHSRYHSDGGLHNDVINERSHINAESFLQTSQGPSPDVLVHNGALPFKTMCMRIAPAVNREQHSTSILWESLFHQKDIDWQHT